MEWLTAGHEYIVHLLIVILIYSILAQSFNLNFGKGGLFNLAHVASYAIGAYAAALGMIDLRLGFVSAVVFAICLSALFSLLVSGISIRLTNDYFAIGTLAFSSLVAALLINWKSITRGVLGVVNIPRPEIGSTDFIENENFLLLTLFAAVIVQAILFVTFRGSFARSLEAQAESEHCALALGIDTRFVRSISFLISSALAGLAGALYASYINYIDPSSFSFSEMVFILSVVIIGKPGSFWGVLAATAFLVLLPEGIRFIEYINERPHILGPARQMLNSSILFAVVWLNRATLFPPRREV